MFYYATGITPAMAMKMIGVGSQYDIAFRDSQGEYLDGSQTYRLNIPGKSWNAILRLYGPLEPWFEKAWRPGDIELVK
jgi:hypothetical protein